MTNLKEANDIFIEGRQLLQAGEYEKAIAKLTNAIELNSNSYYYSSRAEANKWLGRHEEARADSRAAARIISENETRVYQQSRISDQVAEGKKNGNAELMIIGSYAFIFILPPLCLFAALMLIWTPGAKLVALWPGGLGIFLALFVLNAISSAVNNPVYIRSTVTRTKTWQEGTSGGGALMGEQTVFSIVVDGREFKVSGDIYAGLQIGDPIVIYGWRGPWPGQETAIRIGRDYAD